MNQTGIAFDLNIPHLLMQTRLYNYQVLKLNFHCL